MKLMRTMGRLWVAVVILWAGLLIGCGRPPASGNELKVLAVETFLADIAQNVAGDRLTVSALLPANVDPHAFEPTPQDVAKVAGCQVLIINGAGLEHFLERILHNAGGQRLVIEASAGLTPRQPSVTEAHGEKEEDATSQHEQEGDPHFWLAPHLVVRYVENIRDGLSQADPAGANLYAANAAAYIKKLHDLDAWIAEQVQSIPPERRRLATNHESFGYFADRYGFTIIGAVIPAASTGASPSAQQLAQLIDELKAAGAPAIFLETGANPQLAQQAARDAGVKLVTTLYTHSLTDAGGPAPTYLDMMRYNTRAIVEALR